MTDLEISKRLALAIGHINPRILYVDRNKQECVVFYEGFDVAFDYRDWAVIGPIAKHYKLTVDFEANAVLLDNNDGDEHWLYADTPQKAIAMAVIGAKK